MTDIHEPVAATLLTGRHGDTAPMLHTFILPLARQLNDATFGRHGNELGHPHFYRLFYDPVHLVGARNALDEDGTDGQLRFQIDALAQRCPRALVFQFELRREMTAPTIKKKNVATVT